MDGHGVKFNRIWRVLLVTFSVLVAFIPAVVHGQEVNFDITTVDINAEVSANGDVAFQETYTYDIDYMNGADIFIDYGNSPIIDYQVGVVDPETSEVEYLSESNNGSPGTYSVSDDGQTANFRIYHPSEDETVKFVLEYTLDSLITNYNDTAELNRRIVGGNIDFPIDVTASIVLPGRVENTDDFRAWAHGAPQGEVQPVTTDNRSLIEITVPNNPPGQFVEVHAIFPTSLTPNNDNLVEEDAKADIIAAENAQVEEDQAAYNNEMRINWVMLILGFIVGPILTIIAVVYYFRGRHKANPDPAHVPEHLYSLPADISPAVMATAVLRTKPNADDFSATIIDLARKGYIAVEEVKEEKRGIFKRGEDSTIVITGLEDSPSIEHLQKHEQIVLDYVTPDETPIALTEIEERIEKDKAFKKRQNKLWTRFSNSAEIKGEQIKGRPAPQQARAITLAIFAVVVAVFWPMIVFAVIQGTSLSNYMVPLIIVAVINLFVAVMMVVMATAYPPLTFEQDKRKKEWKSFANMLDDIGNMNMREVASLPLWEEYLVYAISLGVADKVLEAMDDQYGVDELEQLHMPSNFYVNAYIINSLLRNSVSSSIASAAPGTSGSGGYSGSNTGGFGGGFSGGSSGGSGGGSGAGGF